MKVKLITSIIQALLSILTPELVGKFADMALDFVENQVKGSKSTVDDAIVLPLCETIRASFGIADNDPDPGPAK